MSRQVRWWTESAISTWQRVAAKPLRDTRSTRERDRLGGDRVDGRPEHLHRHAGAEQGTEEHVAAGAGGRVDPDGSSSGRASASPGDPGGEHAGAVPVVDVDHGDARARRS